MPSEGTWAEILQLHEVSVNQLKLEKVKLLKKLGPSGLKRGLGVWGGTLRGGLNSLQATCVAHAHTGTSWWSYRETEYSLVDVLDTTPFSESCFAKIISQSITRRFIFFTGSFDKHKFLLLIKINLSVFLLYGSCLVWSKKSWPNPKSQRFSPTSFSFSSDI